VHDSKKKMGRTRALLGVGAGGREKKVRGPLSHEELKGKLQKRGGDVLVQSALGKKGEGEEAFLATPGRERGKSRKKMAVPSPVRGEKVHALPDGC